MDFPFVIFGVNTPHIAERIFGHLDNKTLLKCREVSTGWMDYVDSNSTLWDNMADMFGRTPLHYAACEGQYDICHLIVSNSNDKNPANHQGITPLHNAAEGGHLQICQLILDNVENQNPADEEGNTPLHLAAENGHLEVCQLIAQRVQNMNPENSCRRTPLDLAKWGRHSKVVKFFQSTGTTS